MVKKFDCAREIGRLFPDEQKFDKLPDDTQSDITRRVEKRKAELNAVSAAPHKSDIAATTRMLADDRFEKLMRLANQAHVTPGNGRGLLYLMARHFNIARIGGVIGDMTEPGAIKHLLHNLNKYGKGETYDMLSNIQFLARNLNIERELRGLRKQYNIPRDVWNRLKLDLVEVGMNPYTQKDYGGIGSEALEFLRGRQKAVFDKMNSLGLPEEVQQHMAKLTKQAADTYNEVYEIIRAAGVHANDADGLIRYFPRELSAAAVRDIHWEKVKEGGFKKFSLDGGSTVDSVATVFTKSRTSNHFVVEDAIVLDEVLKAADPKIYEKLKVNDIDDLLANTNKLTEAFVRHLDNTAPDVFDALVDTGMISKIPMTTTELFEAAVQKYQLPFKHLNEFVATDLGEAAEIYRNSLRRSVGRSIQSRFVTKAAIEGGWGVTEAERLANPDLYGKYIQLTTPSGRQNVVIPKGVAEQFGIPTFQNSHVYVHPTVADLFRAEVGLLTNPMHLASLGRLFDASKKAFSGVLVSPGYAFRQLYSPFFQTFAAGGRPDVFVREYMDAISNVARLRRAGLTFDQYHTLLDNTRRIYRDGNELLTKREVYTRMRRKGALDDILPWGSLAGGRGVYRPKFDPRRSAAYISHLGRSLSERPQRVLEVPAAAIEVFNGLTSPLSRQLGMFNNFSDNIGRFSTVLSRLDVSNGSQAARVLQGASSSDNIDDAIRVTDEFFFDYSQSSSLDEIAQHVIPFWRFRSRNPFAILKMVIRNPSKFMAYQRLWVMLNEPEREDIIEGAVPEWASGWSDMLWRDEETIFSIPRASFDPIAEGTESLAGIASFFGVRNTPYQSLDDVPWEKTETGAWFREAVNQSYGFYKAAYAGFTGQETRSGRELNADGTIGSSLLGVAVPPLMKYMVENMFPIVANVDRSNPFGVFGTPTTYNPDGTVKELAQPSWIGTPGDRRSKATRFETSWQRALSLVGVNVYQFTEFDQLGYKEDDLVFTINKGRDIEEDMYRSLVLDWNSLTQRQRDERLAQLDLYSMTLTRLEIDLAQLRAWGAQRGMDFSGVVRHARRNNRAVESYNTLTQKELDAIVGPLEERRQNLINRIRRIEP